MTMIRWWLIVLPLVTILAGAPAAHAAWIWTYTDDFSTSKARTDSYSHSLMPGEVGVPETAHLNYGTTYGNPTAGLEFAPGLLDPYATLDYCFPLDAGGPTQLSGQMELDTFIPDMGSLSFSISANGGMWTFPMPLAPGHVLIPLFSGYGTCYVQLLGYDAAIDNLSVVLTPEPAAAALLALGGLVLTGRMRPRR